MSCSLVEADRPWFNLHTYYLTTYRTLAKLTSLNLRIISNLNITMSPLLVVTIMT